MTRPLLFAMLCSLAVPAAHCQKTEKYYDYQWRETDATHARFYSIIEKTDSGWHRRDYFLHSLTLQKDEHFSDSACKTPSGPFRSIYPTRILESAGSFRNGKKQGAWLHYYSDGSLYDSTVYDNGRSMGVRTSWYRNGYMRDSGNYDSEGSGTHVAWFDNGNPSFTGRYGPGFKKTGKWKYYYKAGGLSAVELYDPPGQLTEKTFFDEQGRPQTDTANDDRLPAFPGGKKAWNNYLGRTLYFPLQYKVTNGDEATVVIVATIGEDGRVVDAEVEIPFYPAFDRIALDAVRRSPTWLPAMDHHRKVSSVIHEPVTFSLAGQ